MAAPKIYKSNQFDEDSIHLGIKKLRRRLAEVEALRADNLSHSDQRVKNVEFNIVSTIAEIFGEVSREAEANKNFYIWVNDEMPFVRPSDPQACFRAGIPKAKSLLESLIARLGEKLEDFTKNDATLSGPVFDSPRLHHKIYEVSIERYRAGQFDDAVFSACKVLENLVKEKSGIQNKTGVQLMQQVFSQKNPILAFNELKNQTDLDEQRGLMDMFTGYIGAIRNPRGHSFPKDSKNRALEYLIVLSFLANKLEEAYRYNELNATINTGPSS